MFVLILLFRGNGAFLSSEINERGRVGGWEVRKEGHQLIYKSAFAVGDLIEAAPVYHLHLTTFWPSSRTFL